MTSSKIQEFILISQNVKNDSSVPSTLKLCLLYFESELQCIKIFQELNRMSQQLYNKTISDPEKMCSYLQEKVQTLSAGRINHSSEFTTIPAL